MKQGSWSLIIFIFLFTILGGASAGKMIPVVPDMAGEFGIDPSVAAWLISAITAVSAVLAPVSGVFNDRLGDKKLLIVGVTVTAIANIMDFFAPNFNLLLAARLFEGIGFIAISLGATAMMVRTSGAKISIAMAFASVGIPLGVGAGLLYAGFFAGGHWRMIFIVHAIAMLVALGGTILLPSWHKTAHPEGQQMPEVKWFDIFKSSGPFCLALGAGISSIVMFGFGTMYPAFLMETFHLTPQQASAFGILSYPASVIGSLGMGKVIEKAHQGLRNIIIISLGLTGFFGALIFIPTMGIQFSAIVLFCFYVVGGTIGAIGMSSLPHVAPEPGTIGMTTSLFIQFANVGMLIAPPIVFATYKVAGATGAALLSIICMGAIIALWMHPKISGSKVINA